MYLYHKKQKRLYATFEFSETFTELSSAAAAANAAASGYRARANANAEETNDMRPL
jgi:hypothetical protein